jgi:hypothetical protein
MDRWQRGGDKEKSPAGLASLRACAEFDVSHIRYPAALRIGKAASRGLCDDHIVEAQGIF